MSQLAYNMYQAAGYAGMLYDIADYDTFSYSAEGAIPIGKPLVLGTNKDRQVKVVGTGAGQGALVMGFAIGEAATEQGVAGIVQYNDKETVSTMRKGRLWIATTGAVTAGNNANLTLATGTLTDAAVAAGIEAMPGLTIKFLTSTSAAGVAVIEFSQK